MVDYFDIQEAARQVADKLLVLEPHSDGFLLSEVQDIAKQCPILKINFLGGHYSLSFHCSTGERESSLDELIENRISEIRVNLCKLAVKAYVSPGKYQKQALNFLINMALMDFEEEDFPDNAMISPDLYETTELVVKGCLVEGQNALLAYMFGESKPTPSRQQNKVEKEREAMEVWASW